ncbi:MAG: hypothetical protein PW788_10000 [Micavibrio sp.]|nr:hypothetical protein [Micavibrio sp.]
MPATIETRPTPRTAKRRRKVMVIFALLLLCALGPYLAVGGLDCLKFDRPSRLGCTVNHHAGFAHVTRGMNRWTIEALDAEANKDGDVEALATLLQTGDRIQAMTAAEVLKLRGEKGHAALQAAFSTTSGAGDAPRAALIQEYGDLHQQVK